MTKATYTSEEVQHMLESLFQEKKKGKKLQNDLDSLSNERNQLNVKLQSFQKLDNENSAFLSNSQLDEVEKLQEKLKNKEEQLKNAHLQLLKKQRVLAEHNNVQNKGLDPEDEKSLTEQIQKLKNLVLDYKKKHEDALSSRAAFSAEQEQNALKLQEANQKIFELLNLQAKQIQTIQFLESQKSTSIREADIAKFEVSEAKYTMQQLQKELGNLKIAYEDHDDDNASLKQQQNTLKNYLEETKKKLQIIEEELQISQQKNISNETLIAQVSQDNHRLETQQMEILENLEDSHEFNEMQRQRIDQLTAVIMDKDRKIEELFEFEYSYKQLLEQHQTLEITLQDEILLTQSILAKNAETEKKLSEIRLHADQLEKGMQYLRVKTDEAKQESEQLGTELASSQDLAEQLSKDLTGTHEKVNLLQHELQKEKQGRQEVSEELDSIKNQFEHLKITIARSQQELEQKSAELEAAEITVELFQKTQQQQEQELVLRADHLCAIESEIEVIKQTLVQGIRETKELESRYYEVAQEKASIYYENQQHKQEIIQLSSENSEQMLKLEELQSLQEEKQAQISHWESKLSLAKQQEQEKQNIIFEKDNKIAALSQEMHRHNEIIHSLQNQQNDREAQIKMAQQHLAKKVKENTVLNEKVEEQRTQILELQTNAQNSHSKMIELKTSLETYQQQEARLQDLLNESLKAAELQAHKWEEKYFKLYEKWAETESMNKELKKLEEKYLQMQTLLANFRNVLGAAPVANAMPQTQYSPEPEQPIERRTPAPEPSTRESAPNPNEPQPPNLDLLSNGNPQTRYKHNLFE